MKKTKEIKEKLEKENKKGKQKYKRKCKEEGWKWLEVNCKMTPQDKWMELEMETRIERQKMSCVGDREKQKETSMGLQNGRGNNNKSNEGKKNICE